MPSFLRSMWMFLVGFLSLGPILSPLPLLGCSGGLIKTAGYANAGPLFVLHSSLLVAYGSLSYLNLVPPNALKTPSILSGLSVVGTTVPQIVSLVACSPEWITSGDDSTKKSTTLSNAKGVSLAKWLAPIPNCRPLTEYPKNATSVYESNLPPIGPYSRDDSFMNPTLRLIMDAFPNHEPTSLRTVFYPHPALDGNTKESSKDAGLLVFVHGGGWWSGDPTAPPSPCVAERIAFENGFHYATVEYRHARNGWSGGEQVHDVTTALEHLRREHGQDFDPTRLFVAGSSAGANLGLASSYRLNERYQGPIVAGIFAIAPSTSVVIGTGEHAVPQWKGSWDEKASTERFCEGVADCDQRLSPLESVSRHAPPTVLLHGANDEYYNAHHSRALAKKLVEFHVPVVHIEPPWKGHLLDLSPNSVPFQMASAAFVDLMVSKPIQLNS